ncbi:MAG: exodeoxyribonuclease V subunit gamma [Deltaproteobacteria bacterium]|uniref:Exodeoxyribonuclease V subunit gamma n=1 Tax=Candidatus Zymogenus saltonus TaxID=2844893 RepID=A0A9D8PN49_9DELT|nr:exodeoxyribonuclease V subunit gamma [Candidatus Zymogenus saltonus]
MARLFSGPFQPFLEDNFVELISRIKGEDPFVSITIITPTGTLLKRLTALLTAPAPENEGRTWINLHFFTFYTLSERILKAMRFDLSRPAAGAVLRRLIKEMLVSAAEENEIVKSLNTYDSYADRLLSLFSQLTSYKVSALKGGGGPENAVLSLFHRYNMEKVRAEEDGNPIYTREEIIRIASQKIGDDKDNPLLRNAILYGFYDLNPIQRDIVRTLSGVGDLHIFSPLTGKEPFSGYGRPTLDFFRSLMDENDGEITDAVPDDRGALFALSSRLFSTEADGGTDPDGSIRVVTASGESGEAQAVALQILRIREESPDLKWRDIGVTMRDLAAQRENLKDVFEKYSIPVCFDGGTPLEPYPEVATFLNLLSVCATKLKRKEITTLLFSDYFSWPGIPNEEEEWVRDNSHLAEAIARDAGVVSGANEWKKAWEEGGAQIAVEDYSDEDEASLIFRRERRLDMEKFKLLTREAITGLIDDITDIPDPSTPEEHSGRFADILLKYIIPRGDDKAPYEAVKEIVYSMENIGKKLPASNDNITLNDFISLLKKEIADGRVVSNRDVESVFVSSVMGIRGLSFTTLFLMGLNEGKFPRTLRIDPLISEQTRNKLGLPIARNRLDEERLLFALAVRSAGERLVLSYQRSDDSGRKSIYSVFLRELLSWAESGGRKWHDIYGEKEALPGDSAVHYPRLLQTEEKNSKYTEKDLRVSTALGSGSADIEKVRGVVFESSFLKDGLISLDARSTEKPFSTYDGVMGKSDGILEKLLPMSAGKLETYAECPFRFFMKYVIDVDITEEPDEEEDIEAKEIGTIYHRTLARLSKELKENRLLPLSRENHSEASRRLGEIIEDYAKKKLAGRIPRLVVRARKELLEETLGELIEREFKERPEGDRFIPAHFEVSFGERRIEGKEPTYPPLVIEIHGRKIPFTGRIDRIDVDEGEGAFRVIDYKKKQSKPKVLSSQVEEGSHFQIPIYLLAAKEVILSNKFNPYEGLLVFIEYEEGKKTEDILGGDIELIFKRMRENALKVIDSIEGGIFYPDASGPCDYCSYKDICRYITKGINKKRVERTEGEGKI